ncbi:hypothetical protein Tco_0361223 [Tanacetum coccineum]
MDCALPHTDSEVEALVQKLINEDKGRQDVLLNLTFQFEDSCAVRDDLRKAYEKCNDISKESRALICTLLKESSEKDRKLHLSMYGKAAQLGKQMETKSAWFQEKYSGRTHGGIGCSSSQTDFPLTEKELHQLRMDEEALKEMLEEEAMNKKAQEEKIRQEQAENDAFFLKFRVVSPFKLETFALNSSVLFMAWVKKGTKVASGASTATNVIKMSHLVPLIAVVFIVVVGCYLASVPQEEDQRSNASEKNGDDGDLLFLRSPALCDIMKNTEYYILGVGFTSPYRGVLDFGIGRFLVRLGNLLAIITDPNVKPKSVAESVVDLVNRCIS